MAAAGAPGVVATVGAAASDTSTSSADTAKDDAVDVACQRCVHQHCCVVGQCFPIAHALVVLSAVADSKMPPPLGFLASIASHGASPAEQ